MSEHREPIPSMLYNAAVGGHVTNSQQIIDENINREQSDVNQEVLFGEPYNSTTPNGMGRIVLKKTDNFKTVVEAQTHGNTIFVIKYDFTLTDNVTVPANCILEFDGGSVSGAYTITGNNTVINAGLTKIFGFDVTFAGSWKYAEAYPEWFGAKGDDVTDDTDAFQALAGFITNIGGGRVYIPDHTYKLTEAIYMEGNIEMYGCGDKSVLHLANSNVGININRDVVHAKVAAYLTDGDGTITGKTANNEEVTCKCTIKGDFTIKVSDASKFDEGEYYFIRDNVDFSFDNTRAYYRQGEIIRVKSKDTTNNTITLYNGLYGVYGNDQNFEGYVARPSSERDTFAQRFISALEDAVHRTEFFKLTLYNINLYNFKIYSEGDGTSTASGYYALFVLNIINSSIEGLDIRTDSGSHVAFKVQTAYKSSFKRCRIYSDFVGGDSYGGGFGDIQHFICSDCSFGGRAHSLATGSTIGVVNRDFIYERLIFEPISNYGREDNVLDVHAGAELYTYRDIDCPTYTCDTGGYNVTVDNCTFHHISSGFHRAGLYVRNCNVVDQIGGLFSFSNPWHDYSEDEIIIDGCSVDKITINAQVYKYFLNSIVVRNCKISNRINILKNTAYNIIVENSIITSEHNNSINIEAAKISSIGEEYRNIIIRNNLLYHGDSSSSNYSISLTGMYLDNNTDYPSINSKLYFYNNVVIGTKKLGILYFNESYIENNTIELQGDCIMLYYSGAYISKNTIKNNIGYYWLDAYQNTHKYNVVVTNDNTISYRNAHRIREITKHSISWGTSANRPNTINVQDKGYVYNDTTLLKNIIFSPVKTDVRVINGSFPGTQKDTGVFIENTLSDNVVYSIGVSSKGVVYLSKVNSNPTPADLKLIYRNSSWGAVYYEFRNDATYPYIYINAPDANDDSTISYNVYETKEWFEEDGAIAGVTRQGTFANKPAAEDIYVGFQYFNTDTKKMITWGNDSKWYNPDGTEASA